MRIRDFKPPDLPRLSEIDQTCFPPGISYSLGELSRFIAHRTSRTWVAEEDGEILGFVVAARDPRGVGHIVTIDVLQEFRRHGVGSALMNAAENWAQKTRVQLIYLETAENNLAAQKFYEGRGYQMVDKIEHYYTNGEAAWVMIKRLKS